MSAAAKVENMEEDDTILPPSSLDGDSPAEDVLPFEVWSETSARLTKLDAERRAPILAAIVVAPFSWESSETHWTLVIAADVGEGKMDRARSHGLRCAEEMKRRRERGDQGSRPEPIAAVLADVTAELAALRDEPALPFSAAGSGAAVSLAWGQALKQAPKPGRSLAGETIEAHALPPLEEGALPFRGAAPVLDRWTAKQYASLCAELSVFQAHSRDILARYHLEDDAARRRLDEQWKRRIEADPRLGKEVQELYATYRAYLVKA